MESTRSIHVLIFDGFADWEPAHALAELRRWGKRAVRAVGFTSAPVRRLLETERPVAAICAATLALGRARVLDERRHTSNMRSYLPTHVPEYAGAAHYVEAAAVRDKHVITASGLAPVDFAREVFAELKIFGAADEALWYAMFKEGRIPEAAI